MSSDLRQAAVSYGKRGYRIIPLHYIKQRSGDTRVCSCWRGVECGASGKHPMITGWRQAATSEVELIVRWWRAWPLANIGLLMGGTARLVALDVDGVEGRESLAKLEAEHGPLPETWTQETGRSEGGEHRLFFPPGTLEADRIRNRVKIAPGIDVRSEGGLIVAAPSIHPTGAQYRWRNSLPVQVMPEWLYRLATLPRERQRVLSTHGDRPPEDTLPPLAERLEQARRALIEQEKIDPCIQGQNGSRACLRAAILLIRGYCLPPEDAFDLLWKVYNPLCRPAWSENELMHKIESAELHVSIPWKYKMSDAGGAIVDALWEQGRGQARKRGKRRKADADDDGRGAARFWIADEKSLPNPLATFAEESKTTTEVARCCYRDRSTST